MTSMANWQTISRASLADVVSFLDPAGSKASRSPVEGARSAIVTIGQTATDQILVLEAVATLDPTMKVVDRLFRTYERWRPRRFGIEANAMQSLFADLLSGYTRAMNLHIPFVAVTQPTNIDKIWRIRTTLQPAFESRRIVFGPDQDELVNECKSFPRANRKDLVDALSSAVSMLSSIQPPAVINSRLDQTARYLRSQGADPRYIEKRVQELARNQRQREPSYAISVARGLGSIPDDDRD